MALKNLYLAIFLFSNIFSLDHEAVSKYHDIKVNEDISRSVALALRCVSELVHVSRSDAKIIVGFPIAVGSLITNIQYLSMAPETLKSFGVSPISPYVGVFAAICTLISMFECDDNSEALMRALSQISEQISVFHEQVMKRFVGLEDQIDLSHRRIMIEFMKLHKDQSRLKENLLELNSAVKKNNLEVIDKLEQLRRTGINQHQEIFKQFGTIHTDSISKVISDILFDLESGRVNSSNLPHKIHELYNCVTITSRNSSLTGSSGSTPEDSLNHGIIATPFEHPAYSNVNLIKKYYESKFGISLGPDIVNPIMLIKCADALSTLMGNVRIQFNSDEEKSACYSDVEQITREAQRAIFVLHQFQQPEKIIALTEECKSSLITLEQALNEHIKSSVNSENNKTENKVTEDTVLSDAATIRGLPKVSEKRFLACALTEPEFRPISLVFFWMAGGLKNGQLQNYFRGSTYRGSGFVDQSIWAQYLALAKKHFNYFGKGSLYFNLTMSELLDKIDSSFATHIREFSKVSTVRYSSQPLSILINPRQDLHPNNERPLICYDLKVDPIYLQAERMCLGKVKAYYIISGGDMYVDLVFNDYNFHIKRTRIPYQAPYTDDNSILKFWYGGIYAKSNDVVKYNVAGQSNEAYLPDFSNPYPPASADYALSPTSIYNQNIDTVRTMIEQKLRQQRVVANRELLSKFQLPGNIFSASALIFERTLKVLVGASLLSHHEKTLDGILEKFINGDASILKNKSDIFQRVANYDGSENVQFSDNTVSSLDELQRYMTATKPNFNMLLVAIAKLGEARAALGAGNVVPRVDSAVRLESIVRAQEELRRRVDQMRRDFASQIDDLRGQMDMGIAKILFAIQGGAGKLHEGLKYE